jgi:hypothetical protein
LFDVSTFIRSNVNVTTSTLLKTPQNPRLLLVRSVTPRAGRAVEAAFVNPRRF